MSNQQITNLEREEVKSLIKNSKIMIVELIGSILYENVVYTSGEQQYCKISSPWSNKKYTEAKLGTYFTGRVVSKVKDHLFIEKNNELFGIMGDLGDIIDHFKSEINIIDIQEKENCIEFTVEEKETEDKKEENRYKLIRDDVKFLLDSYPYLLSRKED